MGGAPCINLHMKKIALALLLTGVAPLVNADQILVLSGGGTPLSNHHSQYLQTKTLFDDLGLRFPGSQPTVMFGAGNRLDAPLVLADTHRSTKSNGLDIETMIPGVLAGNSAATQENVTNYFLQPKLSQMKTSENFFLLVSDHGMPFVKSDGSYDTSYENNCIDLWGFASDLESGDVNEVAAQQRCLSKDKLLGLLDQKVTAGRVVFAMSQCYSGGFHKLSVSSVNKYPKANPRICGFTAVTEDTTASGCTPDVDGPNYQGYERSFTEQLTGIDIVTGLRLRPGRASLQEAHNQAVIEDLTKDIPLSTSDFFLWKWALAIEDKAFVPRVKGAKTQEALAAIAAVRLGQPKSKNAIYLAKDKIFGQSLNTLINLHPEITDVLTGDLNELKEYETAISSGFEDFESRGDSLNGSLEQMKALLMRQWSELIRAGKSPLTATERGMELAVFAPSQNDQMALIYMSVKAITSPESASALSDYKSKREKYAMAWAAKSKRKDLNRLAAKIVKAQQELSDLEDIYDNLQKMHGHVRRVLIYRQILGAISALEKMNDQQALNELKDLIECEGTPL